MSKTPATLSTTKKNTVNHPASAPEIIAETRTPRAELIASGVDKRLIDVLQIQTIARDYAYGDFGAISEGHYTEF
jgi:hypothetical protein